MILWSMILCSMLVQAGPCWFSAGLAGEPEMLAKLVDQCNIACFTLAAFRSTSLPKQNICSLPGFVLSSGLFLESFESMQCLIPFKLSYPSFSDTQGGH